MESSASRQETAVLRLIFLALQMNVQAQHGTAWHSMARDGTEHKQTTSTFGCSFDAQTAGIVLAYFPTQFSILLNLQSFKIFKASDRFQSVSLSQCLLQGLPSRARGNGSWIKRLRDTVLRKKCWCHSASFRDILVFRKFSFCHSTTFCVFDIGVRWCVRVTGPISLQVFKCPARDVARGSSVKVTAKHHQRSS